MTEFEASLSTSPLLMDMKESPLISLARAAVFSAIQVPAVAVVQPIDRLIGSNLEQKVTFMQTPAPEPFNTFRYWMQQTGHAIGTATTFSLINRGLRTIQPAMFGAAAMQGSLGLSLKEAAVTGFVHDAVLRPSDRSGIAFAATKIANGVNGALNLSVLSSLSQTFPRWGLTNGFAVGATAGLAAGGASSLGESLIGYGRLPTLEETTQSMYTMSVIGGAWGGWHHMRQAKPDATSNGRAVASVDPLPERKVVISFERLKEKIDMSPNSNGNFDDRINIVSLEAHRQKLLRLKMIEESDIQKFDAAKQAKIREQIEMYEKNGYPRKFLDLTSDGDVVYNSVDHTNAIELGLD